ncbi:MAG: energy transducer TonB [Bacteroidota bacterium]
MYLIFILTAVLACNNNPSKNTKNNNPETINKTDENKATKKTEKKEDKKIYNVADETPYFSECKDIECSKAAINQFISEHLKYPAIAKEDGIEGVVLLSFIINKNGSIQDIKILKDIGSGCGKEAMRVVQLMEKKEVLWTPGKKQGKPVRFKYHLPVRFKLY